MRSSEKLRVLARRLKKAPRAEFNMSFFAPADSPCGTACCIGGHALLEFRPELLRGDGTFDTEFCVFETAKETLGLSELEADALFYGLWQESRVTGGAPLETLSKAAAIRELNRLADMLEKEGR